MTEANTNDKVTDDQFPRGQTPCFYHMDDSPFTQHNVGRGLITPVFFVSVEDTALSKPVHQNDPGVQATLI